MDKRVIVIGSGFGGAITACRLQESGYNVLVLERGRRWTKDTYPRKPEDAWLWESERPEHCNGWLDLKKFPNMYVATGAGVGGGSLIYANISCEAPAARFRKGWPEAISYEELKPHYDEVKRFMNVQEVPDNQWTARMNLMKSAAQRSNMDSRFKKLELAVNFDPSWTYEKYAADLEQADKHSKKGPNAQGAEQGTCVHLGNCDIGCDVGAKNTLDLNYLYRAEQKGAEIRPLHLVTNIEPKANGYRVSFDRLENGKRVAGSEQAQLVIVAAGSLGSTELLLRCKHVSRSLPAISAKLGQNWSSNGDFLTPAIHFNLDVQPTRGPTIASAIDLYDDGVDGGFWIEDGGVPNLFANLITEIESDPGRSIKSELLIKWIRQVVGGTDALRHVMPWFAQGVDAGNGVLSLGPRSTHDKTLQLRLQWDIERSRQLIERIINTHKKLALSTGGIPLVPPTWTLFSDLITPHPLGGCNMANDANGGVVDHCGEVFGYRGLFVIDGAIVPEALGVNPSRTIGALAERSAGLIAKQDR